MITGCCGHLDTDLVFCLLDATAKVQFHKRTKKILEVYLLNEAALEDKHSRDPLI